MTVSEIAKLMTKKGGAGYILLSEELMHNLGNDAAIVYTKLVRNYLYYEKKGELTRDGAFFCTVETLERHCNVSKKQQQRIFKALETAGLVKCDFRGLPRRRYVTVLQDDEAIKAAFKPFEEEFDEQPKEQMPDEVKQQYSKPFDLNVLFNQIKIAAKACGKDEEYEQNLFWLYKAYFSYFGVPDTYISTKSIQNLIEQIENLNIEYDLFDDEYREDFVCDLFEQYLGTKEEENGYKRSINNLFCTEMYEIYQERLK